MLPGIRAEAICLVGDIDKRTADIIARAYVWICADDRRFAAYQHKLCGPAPIG